jgi:hypothetical protein
MHIALVKIENNRLVKAQVMNSKFERNLGETMTIEGVSMKIACIGEKSEVYDFVNELIRYQNRITRIENKIREIKERNEYFNSLSEEERQEELAFAKKIKDLLLLK